MTIDQTTTFVMTYLPWVLSVSTLFQVFLTGNKHRHTWTVGLMNQLLWSIWILSSQTWGMVPMNVGLWIVFYRNHLLWKTEVSVKSQNEMKKESPWKKIDQSAPFGQHCILLNEDAGVYIVKVLLQNETFFTHYQLFDKFRKSSQC